MTHNKHWGMYEGLSQVTNANIDRFDLFLNLELRYFVWVLGGYCDFVCRLEEKNIEVYHEWCALRDCCKLEISS